MWVSMACFVFLVSSVFICYKSAYFEISFIYFFQIGKMFKICKRCCFVDVVLCFLNLIIFEYENGQLRIWKNSNIEIVIVWTCIVKVFSVFTSFFFFFFSLLIHLANCIWTAQMFWCVGEHTVPWERISKDR